ncbi:hypothetical protein [Pseudomonas syringae pv. coryli]|uniref:hypothetical protein n=1 Tax=Pseudomonas syringae pv. coryli TaxID=317659 RepID=UPI003D2E2A6E
MDTADHSVDPVSACEDFIHRVKGQDVRTMYNRLKLSNSSLATAMRTAIMQLISKGVRPDLEDAFPEYAICKNERTISDDQCLVLIECSSCSGILLCCVERYMGEGYKREIAKQESAGHRKLRVPLDWNTEKETCRCSKKEFYAAKTNDSRAYNKPSVTFKS